MFVSLFVYVNVQKEKECVVVGGGCNEQMREAKWKMQERQKSACLVCILPLVVCAKKSVFVCVSLFRSAKKECGFVFVCSKEKVCVCEREREREREGDINERMREGKWT